MEHPFFPLDEELALLPGGLMPCMHECLVRLGVWMPFEKAAQFLYEMLGVVVSPATAMRCTEAAGAAYVQVQTEEADQIERTAPPAPPGADKMVISADGAMVPLRHGEWGEVRTLAVGEVTSAKADREQVYSRHITYFSRLVDAKRFEHLTLVEIQRRGLENSQQVAAVMDGADWLQSFIDYHCPQAVRILDFPHAAQRIAQVGQALWGEGTPQASQWIGERMHQLKHFGPTELLDELRQLQAQHPRLDLLTQNLTYLEKRVGQMNYPHFQQQGWPIGSGMVESGNKLVVEARLKGAGMHWQRANVNSMLGLRNIVCSDRWSTEWPRIARQLRLETRDKRLHLRKQRCQAKSPPAPPVPAVLHQEAPMQLIVEPALQPAQPPQERGSRKPAANHPWRNAPIGRARYAPSKSAKN